MIKEIDFQKNKNKLKKYASFFLNINTKKPFLLHIDPLSEVAYFKKKLDDEIKAHHALSLKETPPSTDWCSVHSWPWFFCVSQKFKDVFEPHLKGYWYPTNQKGYFIFLLDRCIEALDLQKTILINESVMPYGYTSISNIHFKPEVEANEFLFTTPQEVNMLVLSTSRFEELYYQHHLTGIQFYKDINFKNPDRSEDIFRLKHYDDEGNCLNP